MPSGEKVRKKTRFNTINSPWYRYVVMDYKTVSACLVCEREGGENTDHSSRVGSLQQFSSPECRLTTTYTLSLSGETLLNRRSFSSRPLFENE